MWRGRPSEKELVSEENKLFRFWLHTSQPPSDHFRKNVVHGFVTLISWRDPVFRRYCPAMFPEATMIERTHSSLISHELKNLGTHRIVEIGVISFLQLVLLLVSYFQNILHSLQSKVNTVK